jgi:hypothetical protein
MDEVFPVRQVQHEEEVIVAPAGELEDARIAVDDDRPPVDAARDVLDARDRPRGEVGEQRAPVQLAGERQPQREPAVRGEAVRLPAPAAELERRGVKGLPARSVELPHAPEPRRERDLQHGEVGVVEQTAGEVRARRAREAVGSESEVRREEPSQMPRRHAQPGSQLLLARPVEGTVEDQPNGTAHELRPGPRERLRPAVGTALEARAVAGRLGRGRELERLDVLLERSAPAARPAVDPRRADRGEGLHRGRYSGSAAVPPATFGHG